MPYAISWMDEPGTAELRLKLRDAHLDYMRGNLHRVLASGGLLDDPGDLDIVAGLRAPVHDGFVLCHAAERTPRPLAVNRHASRVISTSR